ncbi:hypothetical protein OSG_eHPE5_00075 [environmental Halophage eHP-E5]|nr:hypothetical protein OSG_eHPE5_00075 [environmental Halophage eHP-E5]
MADEGYLIGYEDVNGNFVQIGQFNNAADDVTQPLVLRHTNSGETLELDGSSFRPSTQIGDTNNRPDVFANTVDLNTLVGAGLDTKADLTQSGGVLVASQLPDLAITNIDVVADQTARLALDAEEGDVAIQTDISETFILSTNDPTVNSNWKKVQLDVLGAIDGQTITPAQTGTSTNPTTVESDTVTATNVEAGQIGDSNNRSDVFADTVDANNVVGARQGCRVFLSSDQSITTGALTQMQFDSVVYDSDGNFDTTSHEWTCPEDGVYAITAQTQFASGNNGDRRKLTIGDSGGGATGEGAVAFKEASQTFDRFNASTINKYAQGDIIAAFASNFDSGDTLRSGDSSQDSFLEVVFLGGL